MRLIFVLIGLAISNFAYQAITKHNYSLALERTWFQGVALAVVWLTTKWI